MTVTINYCISVTFLIIKTMQNNSYTVHTIKPTKALTFKLYLLPTIFRNSDMFPSVPIILRELTEHQ